ncbi:hypothetical protein AB0D54_27910 [Streptomyces xanthophaeus]|uniref:hypothetical protein n=1 Tax=Streptomyces xanthophaeus TaxID=67385 RepID=UPI003414ABB8
MTAITCTRAQACRPSRAYAWGGRPAIAVALGAQEMEDGRQEGALAGAGEIRGLGEETAHVQQAPGGRSAVQGGAGQETLQRTGSVPVGREVAGHAEAGGRLQAGAVQQGEQQRGLQDTAAAQVAHRTVAADQALHVSEQPCGGCCQPGR